MSDLSGKTAFVTGAASGLGRRIATALSQAGAEVALADANHAGAGEATEALGKQGCSVMPVHLDVTDPSSVRLAVKQVVARLGRLDIAVNAAGVAGGQEGDEDPVSIWQRVIDVDLNGVYYCCLAYLDVMRGQQSGRIINIASMSANVVNHFPQPPVSASRIAGLPAYCAAKAGVKQLTKVLAAQWAPLGIRVNCISPGYMATEMTREIFEMPEVIEAIQSATPLGRVGQPNDLDGLVTYLASDSSDFMTGAEILIDGGYSIW